MTPDYNDGKWHGWNGDAKCPVHPKSTVQTYFKQDRHDDRPALFTQIGDRSFNAGNQAWDMVMFFRVITPYIEPPKPREFWAYGGAIYDNFNDAVWAKVHDGVKRRDMHSPREPIIHLREVTE